MVAEWRKIFFSNRVVQQWNALPKEMKNAKLVSVFESQYTQWKLCQSENKKEGNWIKEWMNQNGRSERCIYNVPVQCVQIIKFYIKSTKTWKMNTSVNIFLQCTFTSVMTVVTASTLSRTFMSSWGNNNYLMYQGWVMYIFPISYSTSTPPLAYFLINLFPEKKQKRGGNN